MPKNGREATCKAGVHDMMTLIKGALGENLAFGFTKKITAMYWSVVRSNAETAGTGIDSYTTKSQEKDTADPWHRRRFGKTLHDAEQ